MHVSVKILGLFVGELPLFHPQLDLIDSNGDCVHASMISSTFDQIDQNAIFIRIAALRYDVDQIRQPRNGRSNRLAVETTSAGHTDTRIFIGPYFSCRLALRIASEKFSAGRLILSSGTSRIKLITELRNISISMPGAVHRMHGEREGPLLPPSGILSLSTFRSSRTIDSTLFSSSADVKSNSG